MPVSNCVILCHLFKCTDTELQTKFCINSSFTKLLAYFIIKFLKFLEILLESSQKYTVDQSFHFLFFIYRHTVTEHSKRLCLKQSMVISNISGTLYMKMDKYAYRLYIYFQTKTFRIKCGVCVWICDICANIDFMIIYTSIWTSICVVLPRSNFPL